jgi:NADPH:quinone reductase-like Zn-dependent oxidoreductase
LFEIKARAVPVDPALVAQAATGISSPCVKAVRFHEHGGPDVLRVEEVSDPVLGDDDVLVRVRSCALNHFDIDLRENLSRWPLPLPWILGLEFVGDVAAVGKAVHGFSEGERVWVLHELACLECEYCLAGEDNLCVAAEMWSVQRPGGYAEYIAAPARAVFPLPDSISYDVAAAGQIVFTTAWHMLVTRGRVKAGDTVLVSAAGSGVGHAALQIAKLAGATVIATAGSDDKLRSARIDGADHTINYSRDHVTATALDLTGGRGVDLVVENVGGEQFGACLGALRKNGRFVTCGGHAGEVVKFDIVPFFRNEWQVIGSRTGTTQEIRIVMDLITARKLCPRVHAALPLEEAAQAHRILENRENFGKVVLNP